MILSDLQHNIFTVTDSIEVFIEFVVLFVLCTWCYTITNTESKKRSNFVNVIFVKTKPIHNLPNYTRRHRTSFRWRGV